MGWLYPNIFSKQTILLQGQCAEVLFKPGCAKAGSVYPVPPAPQPPPGSARARCTSPRGADGGTDGASRAREERASSSNSGAAAAGSAACERLVGSASGQTAVRDRVNKGSCEPGNRVDFSCCPLVKLKPAAGIAVVVSLKRRQRFACVHLSHWIPEGEGGKHNFSRVYSSCLPKCPTH